MPWRAVGQRRAGTLPIAATSPDPEWMLLRLGTRQVAAVPVLRREGGLLLAIAARAITEAEIAAQAIEEITTNLGPTLVTQAEVAGEDEEDGTTSEVDLLLLDWPVALFRHLFGGGRSPAWPPDTMWPQTSEGTVARQLQWDQLVASARAWVEDGDIPHSDAYATAVEAPQNPSEDLLQQLLVQMQATAASVTQLQAEMAVINSKAEAAAAPSEKPSSSAAAPQALTQAKALVGAAPKQQARNLVKTAKPVGGVGVGPIGEDDEEVVDEGEGLSTDALLKAALLKALAKPKRSQKTKTGLPLESSGSEEDGPEDPLRKLSGARGTMLLERLKTAMESEPEAYVRAIEGMAAQILGEEAAGPMTIEKYVKDELPLGSERSLGYAAWGITRALTVLRTGQTAKGQLILLLTLAAMEQYKLDSSWGAAWRLTQLTQPPFAEWKARESVITQLRADNAHARIVHPTWAAAVIARMRDEEVLTKRRFRNDPPKDPKGKGRGGGRGQVTEPAEQEAKALSWRTLPFELYSLVRTSRTDFARFCRSSFQRVGQSVLPSAELLPCPIPYAWEQASTPKVSRRQILRFRVRRALEVWVNLQICALNFVFLGSPSMCHAKGRRGVPNKEQWSMIHSLRHRTRSLSRLVGELVPSSGSKIGSVQHELASLEAVVDSLRDVAYGSAKQNTGVPTPGSNSVVVPTVASNVAFPSELKGFNPAPFLPEPLREAYVNPDSLLKEGRIAKPPALITSSRTELWQLMWKWDKVNRLFLAPEDEIEVGHVANLFCLAKPDGELRQIIDRRPRNHDEKGPPKEMAKMGHASCFLGIVVPEKGCLRGSLDDLRNFYHEFVASEQRARSTPVGCSWEAQHFQGSQALQRLQARRKDLKIRPGMRLYACFAGLSMGDHWAPAIAQASHEAVLKSFGALRAEEHLQLGYPLPRAPLGHYSGVCIDDKISLQVFPTYVPPGSESASSSGRDLEACALADEAYDGVGLQTHPKKRVRRAAIFSAWGAQFDGDSGFVAMDRSKLLALCVESARLASLGVCSERLLQKVLGLWAFGMQFRRPLFALFQEVYQVGHPQGLPDEPFRLPRPVQQELQLVAVLGALASTDLKAAICPTVFATDASPAGAGIVACSLGQRTVQELLRRADTRGFHTRLLSPVGAHLHAMGIPVEEPEYLIEQAQEAATAPNARRLQPAAEFELSQVRPLRLAPGIGELLETFRAKSLRVGDCASV